jgi:enoyl-CoA hydratase
MIVTLTNPPMNTITAAMHDELATVFQDLDRDGRVKVIVLTGAGERAFSAGGDFEYMRKQIENPSLALDAALQARAVLHSLLRLEKPIIARINGHAIGLGATLALFCDISYAVDAAKIGDAHVAIGYAAGDGGALIWPQLVGYARAREFLLTGDCVTAADAAAWGLITRAVCRDALDELVFDLADRLANGPTHAINLTKVAINLTLRRQFEAIVDAHAGFEFMSSQTADHREAVMAALEKRKPNFTRS